MVVFQQKRSGMSTVFETTAHLLAITYDVFTSHSQFLEEDLTLLPSQDGKGLLQEAGGLFPWAMHLVTEEPVKR